MAATAKKATFNTICTSCWNLHCVTLWKWKPRITGEQIRNEFCCGRNLHSAALPKGWLKLEAEFLPVAPSLRVFFYHRFWVPWETRLVREAQEQELITLSSSPSLQTLQDKEPSDHFFPVCVQNKRKEKSTDSRPVWSILAWLFCVRVSSVFYTIIYPFYSIFLKKSETMVL